MGVCLYTTTNPTHKHRCRKHAAGGVAATAGTCSATLVKIFVPFERAFFDMFVGSHLMDACSAMQHLAAVI